MIQIITEHLPAPTIVIPLLFATLAVALAYLTPEELKLEAVSSDPIDNKYLVCAVEGKADYIISGDHHLLTLGIWEAINLITAKELLDLLFFCSFNERKNW
jgi:predicted nucleic acid-binding protein